MTENRRARILRLFFNNVIAMTPPVQKKLVVRTIRGCLAKRYNGRDLVTILKHLLDKQHLAAAKTAAMEMNEKMVMRERCLTNDLNARCAVCFSYKATVCLEVCKHNHLSLCAGCESETCLICEPCTEEAVEEEYVADDAVCFSKSPTLGVNSVV